MRKGSPQRANIYHLLNIHALRTNCALRAPFGTKAEFVCLLTIE